MIYTKNILTERVIRDLSGGDIPNDSPYHSDFVQATLVDVIRADLKLELLERRHGQEDDRTPITQYIAVYEDVEVKINSKQKSAYIDIPSGYISLKHNKGIHWVADMNKPWKPMIPFHNPGVSVNLRHAQLEGMNVGFLVEGMQIKWMRDITRDNIKKILLKLICPAPDTLGGDDPLPLLPENVDRILQNVKNIILNRVQQDRLGDGNPNIRPQNG